MNNPYVLLAASAALLAAAAGLLYFYKRGGRSELIQDTSSTPMPPNPSESKAHSRPSSQLSIHPAPMLFDITGTQGLIEVIRNRMALTSHNWQADALPVLERYAEFVQLLPASESHHHAHPGGLLTHTLEVASYALTIRQGQKLPAGASTEEQVQRAAMWSFGVMLTALLHDIGKPVADLKVRMFGPDAHNALGTWQALAGAMTQYPGATHYEVDFPLASERDYQAHQRLSSILLHALVPPETLRWLGTDATLLPALIGYLDGHNPVDAQAIADIIKKADAISVSDNLAKGSRVRFAKAKQPPLIERLMWGLRTLAQEGSLAINRPGAALFIDPDGVHFYAVAGVIADKVRDLLNEREVRQEGAAGIPTDNTRLFDTWAEYGSLVLPDKAYGKGSVWWVQLSTADGEWTQVLTVLKLRIDAVYTDASMRPTAFAGRVTPVSPSAANQRTSKGEDPAAVTVGIDKTDVAASDQQLGTDPQGAMANQIIEGDTHTSNGVAPAPLASRVGPIFQQDPDELIAQMFSAYDTPAPPQTNTPETAPKPEELGQPSIGGSKSGDSGKDDAYLDDDEAAGPAVYGRTVVGKPVQALNPTTLVPTASLPKPKNKAPGAKIRPNAERFMAWVQAGLGTGDLSYNESDSPVHFTAEGMALVTPRIFKLYLQQHAYEPEPEQPTPKSPLNALQNDLQRGGYIRRNNKTNFYTYGVKQSSAQAPSARLTTYIIPNPQAYIRPVPSPNPLLELVAQPTAASSRDSHAES